MSATFPFPVSLTYWLRKCNTRVDPHVDNFYQVWSWYDIPLPSYSVLVCWHVTWFCDFDLWPFNVQQLTYIAGHVINLAIKFEYPTPIRSCVTRYKVSHWLPFKMCIRPLRTRRITWPVSRESKTLTFLECPTRFAYSLYNFCWAPTTIKGRLHSSCPMLKPFSS